MMGVAWLRKPRNILLEDCSKRDVPDSEREVLRYHPECSFAEEMGRECNDRKDKEQ